MEKEDTSQNIQPSKNEEIITLDGDLETTEVNNQDSLIAEVKLEQEATLSVVVGDIQVEQYKKNAEPKHVISEENGEGKDKSNQHAENCEKIQNLAEASCSKQLEAACSSSTKQPDATSKSHSKIVHVFIENEMFVVKDNEEFMRVIYDPSPENEAQRIEAEKAYYETRKVELQKEKNKVIMIKQHKKFTKIFGKQLKEKKRDLENFEVNRDELKKMSSLSADIPLLNNPPKSAYAENCKNELIDMRQEETESQKSIIWTEDEKAKFKELYLKNPKKFALIALQLDQKSVQDCIKYYYKTKWTENYNSKVKKEKNSIGKSERVKNMEQAARSKFKKGK